MKTQGHILGAFFYGYAATNFVGGMIAQKVGGKLLMLFGVLWTAVFTLLTPIFTTIGGFGAIFAVRLLEGFGEVSNFYYIQYPLLLLLLLTKFIGRKIRRDSKCAKSAIA